MVEVVWDDAELDTNADVKLAEGGEFGGVAECRNIGYLVSKTKACIVLSISRCYTDNTTRMAFTIPRKMVKEIILLEPQPKEPKHAEHLSEASV